MGRDRVAYLVSHWLPVLCPEFSSVALWTTLGCPEIGLFSQHAYGSWVLGGEAGVQQGCIRQGPGPPGVPVAHLGPL